jgi:hypothetical protein
MNKKQVFAVTGAVAVSLLLTQTQRQIHLAYLQANTHEKADFINSQA